IAVADAEPCCRRSVHHDTAVTGDVLGDFAHELNADVAAPGVLHAARGDQPERKIRDAPLIMPAKGVLPHGGEIAPARQRLAFLKLRVPPADAVLVQPAAEFLADPEQALLIGLLEPQADFGEFWIEIPLQA